jgi:hypothetical protein
VILGGIAWWLRDQPRLFALAVVALVAAQVTSYVRAKAEAIDLDCSVGILERAERAILLMLALLFHRWLLEPVLWLLAVGGTVTVVQRIHHVWCQIDRDVPRSCSRWPCTTGPGAGRSRRRPAASTASATSTVPSTVATRDGGGRRPHDRRGPPSDRDGRRRP